MANTFCDIIQQTSWNTVTEKIASVTEADVIFSVKKSQNDQALSIDDFAALLSPLASKYLDEMATISQKRTARRFGKTIQLYIPLYLSNFCNNSCIYCGFNAKNKIERKVLTYDNVRQEAITIKEMGYKHILIVTGESPQKAGLNYLLEVISILKNYFCSISAEIQPLDINEYQQLINAGVSTVYIYQETYNKETYNVYHPSGTKSKYEYRVNTPDRLGQAGIFKIGLGFLLGLED